MALVCLPLETQLHACSLAHSLLDIVCFLLLVWSSLSCYCNVLQLEIYTFQASEACGPVGHLEVDRMQCHIDHLVRPGSTPGCPELDGLRSKQVVWRHWLWIRIVWRYRFAQGGRLGLGGKVPSRGSVEGKQSLRGLRIHFVATRFVRACV